MVRFADILRNVGSGLRRKELTDIPVTAVKNTEEPVKVKVPAQVACVPQAAVPQDESKNLYATALVLAQKLFQDDMAAAGLDTVIISLHIEKIITQLLEDNTGLLKLAMAATDSQTNKSYLFEHAVNTCIFSLVISLARGYEKEDLLDLGLAAFLHDTGMTKYYHLAGEPRRLTQEEHGIIQNHSRTGADILENLGKGLSETVLQVAYQHHERNDGSGYPRGLNKGVISQHAAIISIADAYEAMTHQRPYREEYTPFEAVQNILSNKSCFEYKLIKTLIERVGIFPAGTLVELNNHSIARVLKINQHIPLRPQVELIRDAHGKALGIPEVIDLAKDLNKHIKRGIKRNEIGR